MRALMLVAVPMFLVAGVARADCSAGCSQVELKVSACHPFSIESDDWMKAKVEKIAKTDPAAADKLRTAYTGVLVEGSVQGTIPGSCSGHGPVLHATIDNPNPPSWFAAGGSCADFAVDSTVTADAPAACCPSGNDVPCFFLKRPQPKPVLPFTPGKPAPHAPHK